MLFIFVVSAQSLYYTGSIGLNRDTIWSTNLTGWRHSSLTFGDIDNDGDYDMVAMGCTAGGVDTCTTADKIRVYINNGTTFNENLAWEANTTNLGYGSLAFGDIDNDGKLDLAVLGDKGGGNGDVQVYINNGTTFNEDLTWEQNLSNIDAFAGSLAFGDIDNDGKLDLALVGAYPSGNNGIYINNGTSFVKSSTWLDSLPYVGHGLGMGALAFGDIDNDGYLDLIFLGSYSTNFYRNFFTNNGTSLIDNTTVWKGDVLNEWAWPSLVLGDYDNDGDLDLVTMGTGGAGGDKLYLFNNTGNSFTDQQHISSFFDGSVAWGDYDNDGDLDLAVMGKEEGHNAVVNNNNTFFQFDNIARADLQSDDMQQGSLAWIDLDNDTDLDLGCSGYSYGDGYLTKIYINNITTTNTKPNPPLTGFSSEYKNNILTLKWNNASDAETNTSGLYYNLMVGNSTNNNSIVSGVYGGSSNPTAGYFGNMMQRRNISLNVQLESNKTYYWYVQTIDTGLAKSNWSSLQTFNTSLDVTKPNVTILEPSPNASLHTPNPIFIFNATVTDANLTNVTLYANWTGSWHINQSNSSGINGTYIFTVNLTNNNDGHYAWYIGANDSSNNSQTSETRSFYLDRAYPIVRLISPSNASSWTSSSTVTFSYNVTDLDIANCSLIINNVIDQTDTSIEEDTTQSFTKSLSNTDYTWKINCTDYVNYTNSSSTYSLTVIYTAPSGNGGGGGGTGTTAQIYSITENQVKEGYTQNLAVNDKIGFPISNINHSLTVNNINTTVNYANLTLNSTNINFLIYINETKKFNLTPNYYNLLVKLNSIENNKANLTIKSIYEEIPSEEKKKAGEKPEEKKEEIEGKKNILKSAWFWSVIIGIVIMFVSIKFLKRHIKYKEWRKYSFVE